MPRNRPGRYGVVISHAAAATAPTSAGGKLTGGAQVGAPAEGARVTVTVAAAGGGSSYAVVAEHVDVVNASYTRWKAVLKPTVSCSGTAVRSGGGVVVVGWGGMRAWRVRTAAQKNAVLADRVFVGRHHADPPG